MIEAIKIDPKARYVIFVRDAPQEWADTVQESLRRWIESPSPVILVSVPGQGQVTIEKIGKINRHEEQRKDIPNQAGNRKRQQKGVN